jgi:multiple sugar transport system substrate-binding protein
MAFWVNRGFFRDIGPYASIDSEVNLDDFNPVILNLMKKDNELLALPYDINCLLLYFNKDLLDLAGIPYPDGSWDYPKFEEQMKAAVAALKAKGKDVYGLCTPIQTQWSGLNCYSGWGTPVVTDEGNIGVNDETVKMLEMWVSWMDEKLIPPADPANPAKVIEGGNTLFINGGGVFHMNFFNTSAFDAAKLNYGVVPLPYGPTNKCGQLIGSGFGILKDVDPSSDKFAACYTLIKMMTSSELMGEYVTGVPARRSLINALQGHRKVIADYFGTDRYGATIPAVEGISQVWAIKDAINQELFIKRITPRQAVDELIEQGTRELEAARL